MFNNSLRGINGAVRLPGDFRAPFLASPLNESGRLVLLPFSIRIVADYVTLYCQITRKLKRAATLKFTTQPAIICINC